MPPFTEEDTDRSAREACSRGGGGLLLSAIVSRYMSRRLAPMASIILFRVIANSRLCRIDPACSNNNKVVILHLALEHGNFSRATLRSEDAQRRKRCLLFVVVVGADEGEQRYTLEAEWVEANDVCRCPRRVRGRRQDPRQLRTPQGGPAQRDLLGVVSAGSAGICGYCYPGGVELIESELPRNR